MVVSYLMEFYVKEDRFEMFKILRNRDEVEVERIFFMWEDVELAVSPPFQSYESWLERLADVPILWRICRRPMMMKYRDKDKLG